MGILEVIMDKDEMIRADAGSFVYMRGAIEVKTKMREGFLKNIKVSVLGGESFFVNDFIATHDKCVLGLSGPPIGDIIQIPIRQSEGFIIQSGAYVASTKDVQLDTKWQGFTKGIFGSDLFMLKAIGEGIVFANSYGGIIEKKLEAGEVMTIDNYHLVAFSVDSSYKVVKFGSLKSTLLGGEGLVIEITGPGTVYFQTKNLKELIDLLGPLARQETQGQQPSLFGLNRRF
jgi:uncharacterized protein (TIGR00266 family)